MTRTQKRRYLELELKRASLMCEAAEIAREQAALACQGADRAPGDTDTPPQPAMAANKRQEADQNRAKIEAYLASIPAGQPGRLNEASQQCGINTRTIKNHLKGMPRYTVRHGLILVGKPDTYGV
jgi:DNA-binding NtrC family response regulator